VTKEKEENGFIAISGKVEKTLEIFSSLREDRGAFDKVFLDFKASYGALKEEEKENFFSALVYRVEVKKGDIASLLNALSDCVEQDPRWPVLVANLRNQALSPRFDIFRKISRSPGGLKFLLDFRGDILAVKRHSRRNLDPLDRDIVSLFEMWFQEGFLYLEEITLDSAYKQIELIKDRDLVHPASSIDEMGQRLGRDRRCFALYHRLIPYEPIIFIEVALTEGLVKNIQTIISASQAEKQKIKADTAIFYSINNTQNGLANLGLGKMLIGRVVDYLKAENDRIKNFATLSPIPGFWKNYLRPLLDGQDTNFAVKSDDVLSYFSKRAIRKVCDYAGMEKHDPVSFNGGLVSILSDEEWAKDESLKRELAGPLTKITYHYVNSEKNLEGKPLNPVAGFHLGNGATVSLKNVNFLADASPRAMREACGFMVNYIYTSNWLSQVRRSFRWFDKFEIKGLFSRRESRIGSV
jgi:hypothetical protein